MTAPIHRVEVMHNGRVVLSETAPAGARSLRLAGEVEVGGSGWLAARCSSDHKAWSVWPQHVAAHTSPIYVQVGDGEVFDRDVADYLITTMEGGLVWLDTLATPERHLEVKKAFTEAISDLQKQMGQADRT